MAKRSSPAARRGRLTNIDLLPDEAFPHVKAAIEALKERRRTTESIREELNTHLLSLGLNPVGRTAFYDYALSLSIMGDRILKAREVAAIFAEKLSEEPGADVGLLVNETMKSIIYQIIINRAFDDKETSIKELSTAALTLYRLEAAKKFSVQSYAKRKETLVEKTTEAITVAGREAGLSDEAVARIRRDVLGVIEKAVDAPPVLDLKAEPSGP